MQTFKTQRCGCITLVLTWSTVRKLCCQKKKKVAKSHTWAKVSVSCWNITSSESQTDEQCLSKSLKVYDMTCASLLKVFVWQMDLFKYQKYKCIHVCINCVLSIDFRSDFQNRCCFLFFRWRMKQMHFQRHCFSSNAACSLQNVVERRMKWQTIEILELSHSKLHSTWVNVSRYFPLLVNKTGVHTGQQRNNIR